MARQAIMRTSVLHEHLFAVKSDRMPACKCPLLGVGLRDPWADTSVNVGGPGGQRSAAAPDLPERCHERPGLATGPFGFWGYARAMRAIVVPPGEGRRVGNV